MTVKMKMSWKMKMQMKTTMKLKMMIKKKSSLTDDKRLSKSHIFPYMRITYTAH